MKKLLSVVLILAMAITMFACSNGTQQPKETEAPAEASASTSADGKVVTAYSFGPMTGGAAWGQFEKGFMDACNELGWEGHYLAPTADNNMSELINLQETAITNGADVMIPLVIDVDAMSDMLDSAVRQNIAMVAVYQSAPQIPGVIGTDAKNLGYNVAEALVKCLEGKQINVVTMQTTLSTTVQNLQVDAFEERLKELRPDAVIVRREECNSSAQIAQDKLSAVCIANPETNALVSFDSYAGLGAASYVESEGIQDDFCVIGIDDAKEILLAIKNGFMDATVAQMWYKMGYESVKLAEKVRNGEQIPAITDSGTAIVMPEDVDAWAAEVGIDLNS